MSYLPSRYVNEKTPVSVKDYGAAGDGITDDTSAIQAAIDAVFSSGGGTVFFPDGIYIITDTLVLNDNITMDGIAGASIIMAKSTANFQDMFTATGASNLSFRGLIFDANRTGRSGIATTVLECGRLVTCTDVSFDHCIWKNSRGYASASGVGMALAEMTRLKISNCSAMDCGEGPLGSGLQSDGTYISGSDITVTNYSANACLDHGLVFEKASKVVASNIVAQDCGGGVAFGNFGAGDVENLTLSNFTITGTLPNVSVGISVGLFGLTLGTGNLKNVKISNGLIDNSVSNGFPAIAVYPLTPPSSIVAITGATNANPIVITANSHGYSNGQIITNFGVRGNTAANGQFIVANKTSNTFQLHDLDDAPVAGTGTFVSGGGFTQPWGRLQGLTIDNVTIIGGPTQGINLCNCDDVLISDCDISSDNACIQGQSYVTGVCVHDNKCKPLGVHTIAFDDGCSNIEVVNNRVEGLDGVTQWGIYFFGTEYDIRTPGNTIIGNLLADESGIGAATTTAPRSAEHFSFRTSVPTTSNLGIWPLGHTIINTSGTGAFGWRVTTEGVAGSGAVFTELGVSDGISIFPLGGGEDDGPYVESVLEDAGGRPVVLLPGEYNFETRCQLPSNAYLIGMPGVTILSSVNISGNDPADAPFFALPSANLDSGVTTVDAVDGATSLTIDFEPEVDQWLIVGIASSLWGFSRRITAVSGSGPYVVTLDRGIPRPLDSGAVAHTVAEVPENIRILGNGMLMTGPCERFIEIGTGQNCIVDGVHLDDSGGGFAVSYAMSYDTSGYNNEFRNIVAVGDGTVNALLALEANDHSRIINCRLNKSGGHGINLLNDTSSIIDNCLISDSLVGITLGQDAVADPGCYGTMIRGTGIASCATGITFTSAHQCSFEGVVSGADSFGVSIGGSAGKVTGITCRGLSINSPNIGVYVTSEAIGVDIDMDVSGCDQGIYTLTGTSGGLGREVMVSIIANECVSLPAGLNNTYVRKLWVKNTSFPATPVTVADCTIDNAIIRMPNGGIGINSYRSTIRNSKIIAGGGGYGIQTLAGENVIEWTTDLSGATTPILTTSGTAVFGHVFTEAAVAATITAAIANTSFTIKQKDKTTNSGTGATLTIQAQNETGTSSIGGTLSLQAGSGTSTYGDITLGSASNIYLNATRTIFRDRLGNEGMRVTSGENTDIRIASTVTNFDFLWTVSATPSTNGGGFSIIGQTGSDSVGVSAAGYGGSVGIRGGSGGLGSGAESSGAGGTVGLTGGIGGDGSSTFLPGIGGTVSIAGGSAGAASLAGGAVGGDINIAGGSGTTDSGDSGGNIYIIGGESLIDGSNGGRIQIIGGPAFGGDVGDGGSVFILSGDGSIGGAPGDVTIDCGSGATPGTIYIAPSSNDNNVNIGASGSTITITSATLTLTGNTTWQGGTYPSLPNSGGNSFAIEGSQVGATVTAPNLDTLTDGSNADALHIHAGTGSFTAVSGEAINEGAPIGYEDAGGDAKIYHGDANAAGNRKYCAGISDETVGSSNQNVTVLTSGQKTIPNAIWDVLPTESDVGKIVYMSENAGKLTLTKPTTSGSYYQKIGILTLGTSGFIRVAIALGDSFLNP